MNFSTEEFMTIFNEENHSDLKKKCFLIAQDIKNGHFTILQLLEQLRELLVNPLPLKRKQGVQIFMEVLQNVPYDFLNIQQLKMISGFYIEKLNDHHQILPVVLQGILRLIKFKYFPEEAIHSILNTIFLNVACQQQQQSDRYVIYQIFQLSLEKYKEALISMKLDLVYGIISSIDGERDPRNLMFLFKWLKSFLTTIPLGHLTEELFEVIACYFPVDFKTPPSIGRDITREDLANELSPCLCAIPEFSEYCIPLALEKLESSLQIAKLDSLNLLRKGCNVFSSTSYLTYATEIWSLLQKEVFSNVDDSVKRECLNTLTTVINKISLSEKGHFISFLNNITTTLRGNLLPDSKLFQPSISILLHTAMGSQESSVYIVKEIVPILTNTYIISHDPTQKAVLLRTLLQFVKTHLKYNSEKIFINNDHLDTVPLLCLKASTEIESNLCSAGFESLADLAEMLSLNVRLSLYKHLHDVIIKPASIEIREAMLNCLKNISFFYPAEVNEFVLYKSKITDPSVLNLYLDALCVIADLEHFREIVTDCFISYAVEDLELAIVAVKNTRNLLQRECNNMNLINKFIQKEIINKFIATKIHCNNDLSFEFLMHISSVLKILIGSLDSELQNQILSCQINVISSYEHSEELYLLLLDGLISRVRNGLSPDSRMLAFLTKISVIHGNTSIRDISVQLLANIINKHPNGDGLVISLDNIRQDCLYYFSTHKSNVIITLSWITKALVMRNHSTAKLWSDMQTEVSGKTGKRRLCGYNEAWEESYKWLTKDHDSDELAKCKIYGISFTIKWDGIAIVKKHHNSQGHQNKINTKKADTFMDSFLRQPGTSVDTNTIIAELTNTFHGIQHHHSYLSIDCGIKVNKKIFSDSEIVTKMSCGRTKSAAICENVICTIITRRFKKL